MKNKKYNTVFIDNELMKELDKYATNYSIGMSQEISKELTETTQKAIDLFYDDYIPIGYNRHYDNFKKRSFKKYYENKHGSIIRGGVQLSSERMINYYWSFSQKGNNYYPAGSSSNLTDYVFNLVYSGYHGNIGMIFGQNGENAQYDVNIPPRMNPSPLEIIINERDKMINNVYKYKKYGIIKARQDSYKFI